jgi:hypothetical protein
MQQRLDLEDVVRIGVFKRWRGLHWWSLAQSNVTRIGAARMSCGVENPVPESLCPNQSHTASEV